tara:strand:+ start:56013 stop:56342 length:330 start_codon:yes stop_codon:yes gene_type:complete
MDRFRDTKRPNLEPRSRATKLCKAEKPCFVNCKPYLEAMARQEKSGLYWETMKREMFFDALDCKLKAEAIQEYIDNIDITEAVNQGKYEVMPFSWKVCITFWVVIGVAL